MSRILSKRLKSWGFFSITSLLLLVFTLVILLLRLGLNFELIWLCCYAVVLAMMVVLVANIVLWVKLIAIPFREVEKRLFDYSNEVISDELFDLPYDLTPGFAKAMMRLSHQKDKREMLKLAAEQSQYMALQNQINPHFLYNTLDAIRGDALLAGMEELAGTIEALSTFFVYSVSKMDKYATVSEELENVKDYFSIQQYRFGSNLKLKITNHSEDEDVPSLYLPRMTLQPIVENAIAHGLEGKEEAGTVTIHLERTESYLLIRVTDNGIGISPRTVDTLNQSFSQVETGNAPTRKRFGGIALYNVNCRIKLLFGDQYGIHIFSTLDVGTDVRITLPVVTKEAADDEERISEN